MKYIAGLRDPGGTLWVYEGHVGGQPIFVEKEHAHPKSMSEENAKFILSTYADEGDRKILIQEERY